MSRYVQYNPNPLRNRVGDCTVRAISKAMGWDWDETYAALSLYGYAMGDMPSANHVWGAMLHKNGRRRRVIEDNDKIEYTVEEFCINHQHGTYILAIPGHVVCVSNGYYYDSWDSGQEIPEYYWERKE